MSLKTKQAIILVLGIFFLASLIFVQWAENTRRAEEAGLRAPHIEIKPTSLACVNCHKNDSPGIIDHWMGSTHAQKGVGCVDCHEADKKDADAFDHHGVTIATIVTPKDCGRCHQTETKEFMASHHAKAGNILHSLDNFLAETVEGSRVPFNPHSKTPGHPAENMVNGMASVNSGCMQCHGSKVSLVSTDGGVITVDELAPDDKGRPTNLDAVGKIARNKDGSPKFDSGSWPNTGIGRLNLDGSRGSCSACHSRHDFSPRRARQPENCGKCHLGPDHPQKEIYEESKHGVAYRDLKAHMNLDAEDWVLGKDYTQAPTCATCHMSAHTKGGKITHDPAQRISWTNRPPISAAMDTDVNGKVIKETDEKLRRELIANGGDSWQAKRKRMQNVCQHCHSPNFVDSFYQQYDDFVINYNEKFAKPGQKIMGALLANNLRTKANFDEEIEWTWFYLWHHEGRRARHGASMMAPDYAHWHGMYEVAERFYMEFIPQAREMAHHGAENGNAEGAAAVNQLIEDILSRPEHEWFEKEKLKHGKAKAKPTEETEEASAESKPDAAKADDSESDSAKAEDSEAGSESEDENKESGENSEGPADKPSLDSAEN